MSFAPASLWSSCSGVKQPRTETPVRITSIGCADGGNCSSAVLSAAGKPRSAFNFALYALSSALFGNLPCTSK